MLGIRTYQTKFESELNELIEKHEAMGHIERDEFDYKWTRLGALWLERLHTEPLNKSTPRMYFYWIATIGRPEYRVFPE